MKLYDKGVPASIWEFEGMPANFNYMFNLMQSA